MVDFVALTATAQRLIEENGRQVVLVGLTAAPANPDRPWDVGEPVEATRDVVAVFVDPRSSGLGLNYAAESINKKPGQVMLVSAGQQVDLSQYDQVRDGSATWRIDSIDVLRPSDVTVLAYLRVSQ